MIDLDDIHSNGRKVCAYCGRPITPDTDSDWEVFVTASTTQPICVMCDHARDGTDIIYPAEDDTPRH